MWQRRTPARPRTAGTTTNPRAHRGAGRAVAGLLAATTATTGLLLAAPVVALPQAAQAAPHPVAGGDHDVALAAGTTVAAGAAQAPPAAGTTVKQVRVGDGALVGVTLDAATDASAVRVRVQDDDGTWGGWTQLTVEGGPDADTAEGRGAAGRAGLAADEPSTAGSTAGSTASASSSPTSRASSSPSATPSATSTSSPTPDGGPSVASEPLWIGEGDPDRLVQVQLPARDAPQASLAVVDPGTSAADAAVAAGRTSAWSTPAATAAAALPGMPAVHSRADWGADESLRRCTPGVADTVRAATVHHTAGTNDYTAAQVPSILRGILRYHTQTQGWCDVGYNALVDRFGGIWEGRSGGLDRAVIGAHAGGFNTETFGVSMIGDYSSVVPSAATQESVARIIAWKLGGLYRDPRGTVTLTSAGGSATKYAAGTKVTLPVIFAHRDVGLTTCPGNGGYSIMGSLRDRVAVLVGSGEAASSDVRRAWAAAGGASGWLGEPSTVERSTPDGTARYTFFTGGAVYWTAATGARAITTDTAARWGLTGWERGPLGYPVTDRTLIAGGSYTHFQGGSVYSSAAGTWAVRGAVRDAWAGGGWERGALGWPASDQGATPDGAATYQHFTGGSLYLTRAGTFVVPAAVRAEWSSTGWERGPLGYPVTGAGTTPDGTATYQHFTGGSVYVRTSGPAGATTGSFWMPLVVRDAWGATGWERGPLGYPVTDAARTPDGLATYQHFEGGSVYSTTATGTRVIGAAARAAWGALGWERSPLGYPTGDTRTLADGSTTTAFQGGTLTTPPPGSTAAAVVARR